MSDDFELPMPPPTDDPHQLYTYGLLRGIRIEQKQIAKDLGELKNDQAKRWDGVERRLNPLEVEHRRRQGENRAWKAMKAMGGMSAGAALLSFLHWLKTGQWPTMGQ